MTQSSSGQSKLWHHYFPNAPIYLYTPTARKAFQISRGPNTEENICFALMWTRAKSIWNKNQSEPIILASGPIESSNPGISLENTRHFLRFIPNFQKKYRWRDFGVLTCSYYPGRGSQYYSCSALIVTLCFENFYDNQGDTLKMFPIF